MNELNRTAVFVAIAALLSAITYFTMPSFEKQSPAQKVGQNLFPDFEDPLEATSLEVVKFDQETASADTFKVAKIGTSWVIPSHNNYPADAEDQLADVAAEWIDLEVLGVATDPEESGIGSNDDIQGLHKLYGVVDPVGEDTSDAEGVGTRVVMRDKSDAELVRLIIGKEVEDQNGLRYVRLIGQDPVYTVKASTRKLSTKFEDWIEDDLLKLSSYDIRKVDIDDYSIDILQGFITPRGQISLDYDSSGDPRWKLAVDREYSKDGWTDRGLGENEELNTETLNDVTGALDDLKIVDVVRKPKGLSETLRSSGSINLDPEAERSLSRAGFHVIPVTDPNNPSRKFYELRSNEGEISATMKDGVKYVLRFGQIAGMGEEKEAEKKDGDTEETDTEKEEETSGAKVNRYLFVMAQMDRSMIEEPEYAALPELPPDEPKADDNKDESEDGAANDDKPEEAEAKEEKDEPKAADKKDQLEDAEADNDKPKEAVAEEEKSEDTETSEAKTEDDKAEEAKEEEPKPTREEIEKQREEIQKENDRKKEEYEEKIKEGEDKVKELNARFADWYYIIDDAEYQKIHLGRDKIVKEKEEEKAEGDEKSDTTLSMPPAMPPIKPDSIEEFESLKLDAPAEK